MWRINRPSRTAQRNYMLEVERLEDRCLPSTLVGLTTRNTLITFDSDTPTSILSSVKIQKLANKREAIVSIDSRPADGLVYGLSNYNRLYTLDFSNGTAALVNTPTLFSDNLYPNIANVFTGPVNATVPSFPLTGKRIGIDIDPVADQLRIVTNADQNFRIDPADGSLIDGNAGTQGVQADGKLHFVAVGTNPYVSAIAYDRNGTGAVATTLYAIDSALNMLFQIGGADGNPSPNAGQLFAIGQLGLNIADDVGFEIAGDGTAYASLTKGKTRLYTINLANGAATPLGKIGSGTLKLKALTSLPPAPIVAESALPAKVQLSAAQYAAAEAATVAVIVITRSGNTSNSVQVYFSTSDGTATADSDYTPINKLLVTFAADETSKTVNITLTNDGVPEQIETLFLLLSDPEGASAILGDLWKGVLNITD